MREAAHKARVAWKAWAAGGVAATVGVGVGLAVLHHHHAPAGIEDAGEVSGIQHTMRGEGFGGMCA